MCGCGWKIFLFFLPKSFRTQEQVFLWREISVKWETKSLMFGFTFVGEFQIHLWSQQCWLERSQWGDISIPLICLENSAWYSPIIFWWRGMNSYDACYWDIFTREKHLKITQRNGALAMLDMLALWSKLFLCPLSSLLTSSNVGAQRIPLMRRNVFKSKNIPEAWSDDFCK